MRQKSADVRLRDKASEIVRDYGPSIRHVLAELNETKLGGKGKLSSAEIGRKAIRWVLEWKAEPITYVMHVAVTLKDDARKAYVDRVLVQREASTPYDYTGHTPTTMMKQIATLDIAEIKRKLMEIWPT